MLLIVAVKHSAVSLDARACYLIIGHVAVFRCMPNLSYAQLLTDLCYVDFAVGGTACGRCRADSFR